MPELNKIATIEAKLDAIVNRLNNQARRSHNVNKVGLMQVEEANQEVAQEGAYQLEEYNYRNEGRSYHFKPNPNLPTHYTPTLRYHENLSYGRGAHQRQGPRPNQHNNQRYAPTTAYQGQGSNLTQQYNQQHHQSLEPVGYQN